MLAAAGQIAIEDKLLVGGLILVLGIAAAVVSRRLSVPILLGFLAVGMLLGSEGPGGIEFVDVELARTIGILGLIIILFEGGLTTRWRDVRKVIVPATLLSTVGVIVTAALVGVAAHYVFDLSYAESFLLGAVVGSTDAAAVFATLRFMTLRRRLGSILGAESGGNDPMAVALTLGLIAWITASSPSLLDFGLLIVQQLGLGLVIGIGLGALATRLLKLFPLELAPFAPVASLAVAALAYGVAHTVGASGFLAVYIVAMFIGNTRTPLRRAILTFHEGLAFLAQVVLFVVLGLLVFPSELPAVAIPALVLSFVLLFLARPLSVWLSTMFQGYERSERLFLGWAGLRGAVPIVLATFALSAGIGASNTIFNAVFFVVIVSTLAQGTTLQRLARRLNLATEHRTFYEAPIEVGAIQALGADILEHLVEEDDAIVGHLVRESGLPRSAIIMLIVSDGVGVPPRGSTQIKAGDRIYVLGQGETRPEIEAIIDAWETGPLPKPQRADSTEIAVPLEPSAED